MTKILPGLVALLLFAGVALAKEPALTFEDVKGQWCSSEFTNIIEKYKFKSKYKNVQYFVKFKITKMEFNGSFFNIHFFDQKNGRKNAYRYLVSEDKRVMLLTGVQHSGRWFSVRKTYRRKCGV